MTLLKALRTVFSPGNVNLFEVFQGEHTKKKITVLSPVQLTLKDGLCTVFFVRLRQQNILKSHSLSQTEILARSANAFPVNGRVLRMPYQEVKEPLGDV
jgi:hypothetical protein